MYFSCCFKAYVQREFYMDRDKCSGGPTHYLDPPLTDITVKHRPLNQLPSKSGWIGAKASPHRCLKEKMHSV